MPAALGVPQFADNLNGSPSAVSVTVGNGDAILVAVTVSLAFGGHTVSVADGGASYSEIGSALQDTTNQQEIRAWYKPNLASGSYSVAATIGNPVAGQTYAGICAVAVQGVTTSPLTAYGPGLKQVGPGTGTDAINSGSSQTPGASTCLVITFCQDTSTGILVPAAGTGFASAGTGWGFGGAPGMRIASKRITSGNAQGTFTAQSGGGSVTYLTQMFAFAGLGAASPSDILVAAQRHARDPLIRM